MQCLNIYLAVTQIVIDDVLSIGTNQTYIFTSCILGAVCCRAPQSVFSHIISICGKIQHSIHTNYWHCENVLSNLRECIEVNGEALQLYEVAAAWGLLKPYFLRQVLQESVSKIQVTCIRYCKSCALLLNGKGLTSFTRSEEWKLFPITWFLNK